MDVTIKDSAFTEYSNNKIMLDLMLNSLQNFRVLINFRDDSETVYHGHDFSCCLGTMSHMVVNSVEADGKQLKC